MNPFRTYFKALTKEERQALADAVGTSVAYLWQIAYAQRRCSASMAIEIEKATNKAVRVEDLLSDIDWAYIRSSAQSIADSPNGFTNGIAASDDVQPPVGDVDPEEGV
jgi:DNA-binding transcriptional regulator YdaS (Cro superfamily)